MKTVLITGGTAGIGKSTAKLFAENGYNVIVTGRSPQKGAQVERELKCTFIQADITDPIQVKVLFSKISKLDILINNAGGVIGQDTFKSAKTQDLDASFRTNFYGAFYCSQESVRIMKKGAIVNVASVCGLNVAPKGQSQTIPIYSAAKAALINFSINLAKLLAPNVRVNVVIPGYTKTGTWGVYMTALVAIKRLAKETLIERFATPEEVAHAIYLLATNEAMTGTQLVVDGGASSK